VQTKQVNGEVEVYLHSFLTLALDGCEWPDIDCGRFTLYKRPKDEGNKSKSEPQDNSKHIEAQEDAVPMPGIEPRFLARPAHNLVPIPIKLSRFQNLPFLFKVTQSIWIPEDQI
jgi:hypothetical protein